MWLRRRTAILALCLTAFAGSVEPAKRQKRTIGVLFRSLVEAVMNPSSALYALPSSNPPTTTTTTKKPETIRPNHHSSSHRPQPQVFLIPLPERVQQIHHIMPPMPAMKPNDLTEIHIHPRLIKQLETLVKLQNTVKGFMVAQKVSRETTSTNTTNLTAEETTQKLVRPTMKPATRYVIKILPEEDKREKGAVSIQIIHGKNGSFQIVPMVDKDKVNIAIHTANSSTQPENDKKNEVEVLPRPNDPLNFDFLPPESSEPTPPPHPTTHSNIPPEYYPFLHHLFSPRLPPQMYRTYPYQTQIYRAQLFMPFRYSEYPVSRSDRES